MDIIEYSNKPNEYGDVFEFFKITDSDYYPPLSERKPLAAYIDPIIKDGNIIYLKENNEIIGMITYYYNYPDLNAAYISTISILEHYRGKNLSKLLMDKCFKDLKNNKIPLVKIKTWSTNNITTNLYPKLGFKIIKVIKDDRGPGVDSIYYEKHL